MVKTKLYQQVSHKLQVQYLLALAIVAVLTITSFLLKNWYMDEASDSAHIINLAGRQRMLSQKLTKMVVLSNAGGPALAEFKADLFSWSQVHYGLRSGHLNDVEIYQTQNNLFIDSLFGQIHPAFVKMNQVFEHFGAGQKVGTGTIKNLLHDEAIFLKKMDAIVLAYDNQATKRLATIQFFERLALIFTLLTLCFEFIFIFKPLIQYVQKTIKELIDSENLLKIANSQLEEANQKLLTTQKSLEKATKSHYEQKIKEDLIRSSALLEGQEEERKRLSREIHDGLGQMLTGVKLSLNRLKSPDMTEKFAKSFEQISELLNETIETTRAVSFNLMPTVLNDFGVVSALKTLIHQNEIASNIKIDFEIGQPNVRFDQKTEITLYRIVQEALNNILKHSKASKAKIRLMQQADYIELSITDNGRGFDKDLLYTQSQDVIHNGVENMKKRAELLNGSFKLTTIPGEGTDIFIKLPIEYNR